MFGLELPEVVRQWANAFLVWVGFGTLVGLVAKAVMPGRDPGGALATLLVGVVGCVIGCGSVAFFWSDYRVSPISPLGFVAAVGGAIVLLFFYRLLSGRIIREAGSGPIPSSRPRNRRRVAVVIEK